MPESQAGQFDALYDAALPHDAPGAWIRDAIEAQQQAADDGPELASLPCDPGAIPRLRLGHRVPEHVYLVRRGGDENDQPLTTLPAHIARQMVDGFEALRWLNLNPPSGGDQAEPARLHELECVGWQASYDDVKTELGIALGWGSDSDPDDVRDWRHDLVTKVMELTIGPDPALRAEEADRA